MKGSPKTAMKRTHISTTSIYPFNMLLKYRILMVVHEVYLNKCPLNHAQKNAAHKIMTRNYRIGIQFFIQKILTNLLNYKRLKFIGLC